LFPTPTSTLGAISTPSFCGRTMFFISFCPVDVSFVFDSFAIFSSPLCQDLPRPILDPFGITPIRRHSFIFMVVLAQNCHVAPLLPYTAVWFQVLPAPSRDSASASELALVKHFTMPPHYFLSIANCFSPSCPRWSAIEILMIFP